MQNEGMSLHFCYRIQRIRCISRDVRLMQVQRSVDTMRSRAKSVLSENLSNPKARFVVRVSTFYNHYFVSQRCDERTDVSQTNTVTSGESRVVEYSGKPEMTFFFRITKSRKSNNCIINDEVPFLDDKLDYFILSSSLNSSIPLEMFRRVAAPTLRTRVLASPYFAAIFHLEMVPLSSLYSLQSHRTVSKRLE